MRKLFVTLLLATSLCAAFAQAPAKPPSSTKAPELTVEQKYKLTQLELRFINNGQQINALQQQAKTLQQQYADYTKDLCKSSDGKTYVVELGEEPACKEVQTAVKK